MLKPYHYPILFGLAPVAAGLLGIMYLANSARPKPEAKLKDTMWSPVREALLWFEEAGFTMIDYDSFMRVAMCVGDMPRNGFVAKTAHDVQRLCEIGEFSLYTKPDGTVTAALFGSGIEGYVR